MPPVIAVVAAFVATYATAITIATVILSAGMALYGSAQARRAERDAKNNALANMKDRMVTRIATESPHRHVYGRAKVGADIVAMFTSGDRDQFKHLVCVHAAHECDAIEEVWVNNALVSGLDASGDPTTGRFAVAPNGEIVEEQRTGPTFTLTYTPRIGSVWVFSGSGAAMVPVTVTGVNGRTVTVATSGPVTVSYEYVVRRKISDLINEATTPSATNPVVRVQKHLGGASDVADAYLRSVVGDKWPATAVLRGLCYTVITLDLNQPEFQSGIPPIHAVIRGKKLYDPRDGVTRWSQNPALAIRDYLTGPLCGVPAADLPAAQFITAANVCDEASPTGGVRYTLNGTVTSDQGQASVLESMVQAMAGGLVATTWDIYAGKYTAPVAALLQSDIVGGLSVTPGVSDASVYNGVKGQYIGPENAYVQTDFKPYQNSAYRVSDGRDLYTNIDFPFTDSLQRVTNLARIFTEDQRNGFTIRAEFSLKAWPLKVGQRITFTSSVLGHSAKVFRITDKSYSPTSAVQLTLKEDAASIWDYADATVVDSTPNTELPDPWKIDAPASLSCTSGEAALLRQADGTTVPRIMASWPAMAQANGVQIEVEWRAVQSITWERTTVSGGETRAYLSPITPGFFYIVRARTVNPSLGVRSNWIATVYQVEVFTATPTVYQWATNKPATPSGAASYAWPTGAFGAAPAGWSLSVPTAPTGGNVILWAAVVAVSDVSDVSSPFDWSQAEVRNHGYAPATAGTGPAGYSNAYVKAYQRKATAPTGTPGAVDVNLTTGTITTATLANGWLKDIPAADGNPLYVTAATASAAGATDTIASNEWSGAVVLMYDGGAGTPGLNNATVRLYQRSASATVPALPSASATYTFASGVITGINNGWLTYIPTTGGQYLHTTQATAIAATATDSIPSTEWAASQLMYDAADLIAAKAAADAANSALAIIADDGVLSKAEKSEVILKWNSINNEKGGIDAQATALGITTEKNTYGSAYAALLTYLQAMAPNWDNLMADTNLTAEGALTAGTTFRKKFSDVYLAKQALLNAIAAKSATLSTWAGTTGTGKPADNATADVVLTGRGVTITGNNAKKSTATNAWDADCYSRDPFVGGAFARLTTVAGELMFGLNSDPTADTSFTSLDYAINAASNGTLYIYESNVYVGSFGTYAYGDTLEVAYDGSNVRYIKNGTTILRTVPALPNLVLYFDSSFATPIAAANAIRFGPLSSNNWSSVGGAGKPADNASSDLVLLQSGTVTVSGNRVVKTSGVGGWDSSTTSRDGYVGGAYISARSTVGSRVMMGLNTDPYVDGSWETIDYAIYVRDDGAMEAYESGSFAGSLGTYAANDLLAVVYDGSAVRYLKNGVVLKTTLIATPISLPLFFDSSFYLVGSELSNIRFGPLSSNNWNDMGGTGKPQSNATVGAPAGTNVGSTPATTIEAAVNANRAPFSVTMTGLLTTTVANGARSYGNKQVTINGGVGPYSILWTAAGERDDGAQADYFISGDNTGSFVNVRGSATNMLIRGQINVTVIDLGNGNKAASAANAHGVTHGTYTPP